MFRKFLCLLALSCGWAQCAHADDLDEMLDYLVEARQADLHEEQAAQAASQAEEATEKAALPAEKSSPAKAKTAKPTAADTAKTASTAVASATGSYRF